ncbi:MAG TPA: ABC transporter permease [Chryseolinea sp.]|nr:ABC transporter permease [Chryseolinea sp.]
MIKNYLVVALRNIFRNKLFASVNVLGLVFGICSALLIFLWVKDELSYDKFHTNSDRLYRVMENQTYSDGRLYTFAATPGPMAPFIKEKFPEIEKSTRFTWDINRLFQLEEKSFYETGKYVDPDFLAMFTFPIIKGDASTALNDKHSIVITQKMATKYFGNEDPIGKTLLLDTKDAFSVSAVMKDIPVNSFIQFDYLLPFAFFWDENKGWLDQWGNNNIRTFIMLQAGADVEAFSAKFKHEIKEHNEDTNVELFIQKYGDIYLHGNFENGVASGGRIETVRIFFVVAVFVLVIACINFMNLSTAQATKRAKEVGLRKVIGAGPGQVFRQFMGESFLTVFISASFALVIALLALPLFNTITAKKLDISALDASALWVMVGIVVFTAFAAGIYPSLMIAAFKPVQVMKGQLKSGSAASTFRRILVVFQFSLSIILIICTAVVFRQVRYMENRDIGFARENVFYAWVTSDIGSKFETFRSRLASEPGIETVTGSGQLPISIGNSTMGVSWEGKDPNSQILFTNLDVDFEFVSTLKMTMAEGRAFDRTNTTDTANYIVNEKAAEKFGFTGGTADRDLTMWERKGKIVGVVKDFNFGSLHSAVDPLIIRLKPENINCLIVRVKEGQTSDAIKSAEKLWKEYAPGYPFKYSFLDQDWEEFYSAEAQQEKVFNTLATLSIFISCLGLFGLSAFSAERRTKELGIRKTLGATVPGLVRLMGTEFTGLVLLAACIGCPLGWYLMTLWLAKFAFHIDVGVLTLASAAFACLFVSLVTIAYHSIRVAGANPVRSLRQE